jgi:hypothetical protein
LADSFKDDYKMENEKITKVKTIDNSLHGIARAYTLTYSCCYIISPFFGLQNSLWGPTASTIMLISVGIGLLAAIFTQSKALLFVFGVAEAVGCVAHFLKIVPWIPAFSDTAYVIMSLLDLTQSLLLFLLLQEQDS